MPAINGVVQTVLCLTQRRYYLVIDTTVKLSGILLRNPVIAASGCFGFGQEYDGLLDLSRLGGICTKALTVKSRAGNSGVRLHETPSGLMNSIGLENPGINAFLEHILPRLRTLGPAVIANLAGSTLEDYIEGARLLSGSAIDAIELNISCPNVMTGGQSFGLVPDTAVEVTRAVRHVCSKPLIIKLSPNAPDIVAVARALAAVGADALSLVNTFQALAIDIRTRKPVFDNIFAGLSGPAIRPLALRAVWQVREAVNVPIIGIGGIARTKDALEFLMAGASAIEVGSATFAHPPVMGEIIDGIAEYLRQNRLTRLEDLDIRKVMNHPQG
jgi:dihydroorotate dehydrogenase (NAD+) catalytic subunit